MFKCWVEDRPFAAIVHVQGDVDLITAPEFRQCVHSSARSNTGDGCVAVDLSELEYLDATGFLALEEGRELCRQQHKRELVLLTPPPHVEQILKLLELAEFPVLNSIEALALRATLHTDQPDSRTEEDTTVLPGAGKLRNQGGRQLRGRQTS